MRLFFIPILAIFAFSFTSRETPGEISKIIVVKIDEIGVITDGRDTISSDELSEYIRERLFKSYTGTGKMYDRIRVEKIHDGPVSTLMDILLKEIASGQKKALTELCLHKYKQGFDNLKSKQQQKIRKQFPVLFQTNYD